ncbi:hypothetical protein EYC84_008060 [Monilinia fructicola]|uniref:J domain-containing protein n=1 Tax=Monilinia fructicola TaxID=38448 RepID=A0A5M9JKL3_MONFR|nr:hypothetical protein EYC84_008060 [Monilinia fructicola]
MTSPRLPPDPYKILCHPDKVQDPKLKAIKVDEFQKVQEAYEILSDVSRRSEYDQSVKLQKLREELGKTSTSTSTSNSNPTPASTSKTYDYNVRTAEPRTTTYSASYPKASQKPAKESNVYSKPPPRSHEDLYDEPVRPSVRRSKTSARDTEKEEKDRRKHHEEDEREKFRRKVEKEAKRDHGDRKKSREKEKRRSPEEKSTDEKAAARRAEETMRAEMASRAQQEREARDRERRDWDRERERELRDRERERERERDREPPAVKDSPMGEKWKDHMANAARYVQASRRDSEIKPEVPFAPAPPVMPTMRRAETFAAPSPSSYNIRYETVRPSAYGNHSDDETPRRSSAARPSRRSAETPSKAKETPKSSRRSTREAPYVNTASTSPTKPTLHKQYSEPPIVGVGSGRREPSRSKTEYPREPPPPPSFF